VRPFDGTRERWYQAAARLVGVTNAGAIRARVIGDTGANEISFREPLRIAAMTCSANEEARAFELRT
jgi:hypothetical protein